MFFFWRAEQSLHDFCKQFELNHCAWSTDYALIILTLEILFHWTFFKQFLLLRSDILCRIASSFKVIISYYKLFYRIVLIYVFDYLISPFNKMLPFRNLILKSRESHLPNFQTSKFNTSALEMHLHQQQQHMYTNFWLIFKLNSTMYGR